MLFGVFDTPVGSPGAVGGSPVSRLAEPGEVVAQEEVDLGEVAADGEVAVVESIEWIPSAVLIFTVQASLAPVAGVEGDEMGGRHTVPRG